MRLPNGWREPSPTVRFAACWTTSRTAREELMLDVRRREFITLLGGAAAAWPLAARAQKRMPTVGVLLLGGAVDPRDLGLVRELARIGYVEGRNIAYTVHGADGAISR